MRWEHADEARAALNAIVTDPEHGVAALSSPRTMSNLLKDLLPDAPREKNLLIAAAEAGLADTLNEHVSRGMDSSTAIKLTASSFSARTPLTPDACSWVAGELAVAMGISETNDAVLGDSQQEHHPADGRSSAQDDAAPPVAPGFGAASAVVAPGPPATVGYQPAPGMQPPGPQLGYQHAAPGYVPPGGYAPGTPVGYAPPGSPGGLPPTAFSPAQNPQAYGPGIAPGMPAMPGYPPIRQPTFGRRSNTLAVTSMVLGVAQFVGWFIFLLPGLLAAILAIVLGFVSLRQVNRTGENGRGLAIAGVVLGFIGIIVVVVLAGIGVSSVNTSTP
jgi:hypothetical protein